MHRDAWYGAVEKKRLDEMRNPSGAEKRCAIENVVCGWIFGTEDLNGRRRQES